MAMPYRKLDAAIRAVAESLSQPGDRSQALERIVTAARDNVSGTDYASITVRHLDDGLETIASSDPIAMALDELQYTLREGPCYDAVTADTITYSDDLADDSQWPRYGPGAAELGLNSQLAVRIAEDSRSITGLNLYSRSRKGFEDTDGMPGLFASQARIVLGYATHLQTLQGALDSRETIGQAVGILRERYQISAERAFEYLVRLSQNNNVKLRDVAASINAIDPEGPPAIDSGPPTSYPFGAVVSPPPA
jgi:ANTAR domain-containing protein